MKSWEEQRDEICRLNDLCLEEAGKIIEGKSEFVKYYSKDGEAVVSTVLDGMDLLARCSNIAKQWTAELRQTQPEAGMKKEPELSNDQLARKSRNVG